MSGLAPPPISAHSDPDVIVVGGGIAGLAAAFRLQRQGWRVTVLEAADRCGGKMASVERDGFVLNRASTIIPSTYSALMRLCADAGMGRPFKPIPTTFGIPWDGKLKAFRGQGARAAVDGVRTDLLSWRSKLLLRRLGADAIRFARSVRSGDFEALGRLDVETLADYADRRLNAEIYERLLDPLMRGLYLAEPAPMSVVDLFITLGKFAEGGLTEYPNGIDFLARHLAQILDVRTGAVVQCVERTRTGVRVAWSDGQGDHEQECRGSVLAVGGAEVLKLYPGLPQRKRELIDSIRYSAILKGVFAMRRVPESVPTVLAVPTSAGIGLGIVLFDSKSMPGAAPPGKAVISGHWVDSYAKSVAGRSDDAVAAEMIRHVDSVLPGVARDVEFTVVERWLNAAPDRYVGFYRTVAELRRLVDPGDPIQLAGDYFAAPSTNNSAEAGERSAVELGRYLRTLVGSPQPAV